MKPSSRALGVPLLPGLCRPGRRLATSLLLAVAGGAALADEPPRFAVSGFGTLGVVRSDKNNYHFHSSGTQATVGRGQSFDASTDSVLGLQGTGRIDDRFNVTIQAITRQAAGYNYTPHVTWAYLNYQATPALTLRVGRTTTPFFMFSDSLNVNYATPWLRPPVEVYSLNPFSDLDGIDLLYRIPLGEVDLEVQGLHGNSAVTARSASARLKSATGIRFGLTGSGFTAQAGYTRTNLQLQWTDGLYKALGQQLIAHGESAAAAELAGIDGHAEFFSAGFQWEKNNWITIAEFVKRQVDRYTNSAHAWYVTTGYRFDALTPYVTFSQQVQDRPAFSTDVDASHTPLIRLYNTARNTAQHSVALGMRWDVARNIAIKSQIERVTPAPGGRGMFTSDSLAEYMKPATPVHLISFSLDFVF